MRVKVEKLFNSKLAFTSAKVFVSVALAGESVFKRPFLRVLKTDSSSAAVSSPTVTSRLPGPSFATVATTTGPSAVIWLSTNVLRSTSSDASSPTGSPFRETVTVIFPASELGSIFSSVSFLTKLISKAIMPSKLLPLSCNAFNASSYA